MTGIGELLIVGAVVSLIVQFINKKFGLKSLKAIAAVVVVSLIAGIIYDFLGRAGFLERSIEILASASAVYALLISRFSS